MPIAKNSYHTITIADLSPAGQGLGVLDNVPVIVERALPGERVQIKIIKLARTYIVGKLVKVISSSPDRAQPFCDAFPRCGGCSLQHLTYPAQLRFKTKLANETITAIGQLANVSVHATMGMDIPRYYRNKAQYPIRYQNGRLALGFYAKRSHTIIEHRNCDIQPARMTRLRAVAREFLEKHNISIYNETQHTGLVRHLMIRAGLQTGEYMVVLVVNGHDLPYKSILLEQLRKAVPEITSVVLNINQQHTNVILGSANRVIYGNESISDILAGHRFEISARSFYQVNPAQTETLYRTVLDYAGLQGTETVVDLFCGIGTITLLLASRARMVYGIDSIDEAIHDATSNAIINSRENVEFLTGKAEHVLPEIVARGITADVVVIDPPRKGCDAGLLETLVALRPARMVYVSCHLKTLARDLRYLSEHGFIATAIQPVDLFPYTPHVECVATIEHET